MQEMLDDIAEQIDIVTQKIAELKEVKKQEVEEEIDEIEEVEEEEILDEDLDKKEKEDDICFKSININTASKEELQKLTGIGPVLAQRIIEARPFYSLNDLLKVNGIGEKTLQGIIEQDCVYALGFAGGGSVPLLILNTSSSPQITLNYSEENPVNKEIKVELSASNLKSATYDVKISIEKEEVLSEIYDEREDKWQSSQYYLKEFFSETSFSGNFKLKIKEEKSDFRGEADIFARVRESGKSSYSEFKGKINITDPEQATSTSEQDEEEQEQEEQEQPQEATTTLEVVINEIAWMGTNSSANDEWIELYNNTTSTIDITGWRLISSDGSPDITFSTSSISANDYYLLERTDDTTISNISADLIYNGALENIGERLELRNALGDLIDLVDCSSNWFSGNSDTKRTMERINSNEYGSDSANWENNNLIMRNGLDTDNNKINGTPKAENSVSVSSTTVSSLSFDEFPEITLTYLGSPYFFQNTLTIPASSTLDIEPGVILQFKGSGPNDYKNVDLIVYGTLSAQGSENEKIVFTSNSEPSEGTGWWGQIYFSPSSQNSILEHCQIRYGGKKSNNASIIIVDSTSIEFKDCLLENFNVSGLKLIDSFSQIENSTIQNAPAGSAISISGGAPIIKNSIFKNTYSGMIIEEDSEAEVIGNRFEEIKYLQGALFASNSCPILKDNTGQNNVLNGIYFFGPIAKDCTLYLNNDFPYIANFQVTNSGNLIIEPGVIIKFQERDQINIDGKLFAQGSLDKKIVFTSVADDEYGGDTNNDGSTTQATSSFWDKIYFSAGSECSLIKNAEIRYGGIPRSPNPYRGVVYVLGTGVEFENVYFKNTGPSGYTLYLENSSSTVRNSFFDNSEIAKGTAINIVGQDQNILENNTFQNFHCHIMKDNQCLSP